MAFRSVMISLWVLSLFAAAQIGASAQLKPAPPPPGVEVRFVPMPTNRPGVVAGRLTALVGGQWVPVTLAELQGGIVPLRGNQE